MKYYKTGSKKTVQLDWNPIYLRQEQLYYSKNTINYLWNNNYKGAILDYINIQYDTAIVVGNSYYSDGSCCDVGPSKGGTIEYRAYNCIPSTYRQLIHGGVIINPRSRWGEVRSKLKINNNTFCEKIVIIAFFIPSVFDRQQRGLRPTYSNHRTFMLCPGSQNDPVLLNIKPSCKCPTTWSAESLTDYKCPIPNVF